MKKLLSVLLISLISTQCISTIYADCDMSYIDEEQIDFTKLNKKNVQSITQTIGDKTVTITKYDKIFNIKSLLNNEIKSNKDKRITIENEKIDPGALYYFLEIARNLITNQSTTAPQTSNETVSKISLNDLKRLPEKGESNSITQGKLQGALMSLTTYGSSIMGTLNTILKISKEGFKGFKNLSPFTYICFFTSLSGFAYNYYQTLQSSDASRLITVYKNIKKLVYEEITKHKWIGNNVLITAVPTDSSCFKGYAGFHNVDGVRYSKSQKAINWEFAQAECQFLNADHDDCYQEAKKNN